MDKDKKNEVYVGREPKSVLKKKDENNYDKNNYDKIKN